MFDREGFHNDRLEAAADREIRALEREIRKLEQENQELRGGLVGNDEGLERARQRLEWCRQHNEKHKRERDEANKRIAELEAALTKVEKHRDGYMLKNVEARDELAAVRSALSAHDDSDLASLAETLVAQRRRLAAVIRVVSFGEGVDFDEYGLGDDLRLAESILEEGGDD